MGKARKLTAEDIVRHTDTVYKQSGEEFRLGGVDIIKQKVARLREQPDRNVGLAWARRVEWVRQMLRAIRQEFGVYMVLCCLWNSSIDQLSRLNRQQKRRLISELKSVHNQTVSKQVPGEIVKIINDAIDSVPPLKQLVMDLENQVDEHTENSLSARVGSSTNDSIARNISESNDLGSILAGPGLPDLNALEDSLLCLCSAFPFATAPSWIFDRLCRSQSYWDDGGRQRTVDAADEYAALDHDLATSSLSMAATLSRMVNEGLLLFSDAGYTVQPAGHDRIAPTLCSEKTKKKWRAQALSVMCFIFPRDAHFWSEPSSGPGYAQSRQALLSIMMNILDTVLPSDLSQHMRNEIADSFLSGTTTCETRDTGILLSFAARVLDCGAPKHLQIEAAYRNSIMHRLRNDHFQSEICLRPHLEHVAGCHESQRLHAAYGRIHVSHLENLIQTGHYNEALNVSDKWSTGKDTSLPGENPSTLVLRVLPNQSIAIANSFRALGQFTAMYETLKACPTLPLDTTRYRIACARADADIELGEFYRARSTLEVELQKSAAHGFNVAQRGFRRLLVSLVDVGVQGSFYDIVKMRIPELLSFFDQLQDPNINDQMFHLRTLIARARFYHTQHSTQEAFDAWNDVIVHVQNSPKSMSTYAVAKLSQWVLLANQGVLAEARSCYDVVAFILVSNKVEPWFPTLGTWACNMQTSLYSAIPELKDQNNAERI